MGLFLRNFVEFLALALAVLILGRVFVSRFDASGRSPLSVFLVRATEPILAPIRRLLPRAGMLDLSPMIAMLALSFLAQALR